MGWSVLSTLRNKNIQTRILLLTAMDSVEDRVKGLELGADDYLVKPFAFSELLGQNPHPIATWFSHRNTKYSMCGYGD